MADVVSAWKPFDLDTGGGTEYIHGINLRISASGGSIEAKGQQLAAASLPVVLASDQNTVDTELPAAASLTDDFANPTAPAVGAFTMVWDGSTWDRAPGTSADGLLVNLGGNNDVTVSGTVTVDSELPNAALLADDTATPTVPGVGAFGMYYDGATWDMMRGDATDGMLVNLGGNNDVTVTGTVTVDSELPAAGALADDTANPTVPGVGAFLMGYDSGNTNWNRVEVDDAGHLQVDVLTGGGTDAPTNPVNEYVTSASLASEGSANLDTSDVGAKKLEQIEVWSSRAFKAELYTIENDVASSDPIAIGGADSFGTFTWKAPHPDFVEVSSSAGTDGFRVTVTNLGTQAVDVYATFHMRD